VSLAKNSSTALSQDAEVGVKWKVQRGCRASALLHTRRGQFQKRQSAVSSKAVQDVHLLLGRRHPRAGSPKGRRPLPAGNVGATPEGKKELVGLVGRSRKSGWPSPAFNALVETWGYEKAVECLTNEREALVYDLPVK
jgi:hypothetical protein